MFRTAITIVSAMLAVAVIAVPVASTASPRTSTESQVFSLSTALFEYQHGKDGAQAGSKQGPAYSLGPALLDYQRGTGFFARPTATARDNGFDWWAAAIGAGIAVGALLLIGGIGAMTIRARHQSQTKLRTT